jgi:DNA-binding transcriptional regulator GbsR (MarR family)
VEEGTIELEQGVYYIDIRDIYHNYQISHPYFDIELIGFGKIFIDTTDVRGFKIIPLNNTISIKLKDGQTTDVLTELYLYPHMLLKFNPTRNKFLKNADLVRIDSVFSLEYISEPMFFEESPEILGEDFAKIHAYETSQKSQRDELISRIFSLRSSRFPGEELIEKYSGVFVNTEKKDIYLKNKAHTAILKLIQSKQSDDALVQEANEAISQLKHSPTHYSDIENLLSYIYKHILFSSDIEHLQTKIGLAKLMSALYEEETLDSQDTTTFSSSFFLDSLYSRFDTSDIYSYPDLVSFYTTYIKELGIDIREETTYEDDDRGYLEYL